MLASVAVVTQRIKKRKKKKKYNVVRKIHTESISNGVKKKKKIAMFKSLKSLVIPVI